MIVKLLSKREFQAVYRLYIKRDFPRAEKKPLRRMERLIDTDMAQAYGLYCEEGLTAYAYFIKRPDSDMRLLDYYAVCAARGKRYGSAFMAAIAKLFERERCLIAEAESPDAAAYEAEITLRHRRKAFYARNGWDPTACVTMMNGMSLDVMTLPLNGEKYTDTDVREELDAIYRIVYPRAYKRKRIYATMSGETQDFVFKDGTR